MGRKKHIPYFDKGYDTKERFVSYWHQINEIVKSQPDSVLEIGIGNKFVSNYLKSRHIQVATVDVDTDLEPDIGASILSLPFKARAFDTVTCCEVLEHLPYSNFARCLKEVERIAKRFAVISLPDVTTNYRIHIELPRLKTIHKMFQHPFPRPEEHVYDGEHYWEIGKREFPLKKVLSDIDGSGLTITSTYRIYEFPYHRFFILKPSDSRQ
jgi:predicted SAM-dependent methyltransferase